MRITDIRCKKRNGEKMKRKFIAGILAVLLVLTSISAFAESAPIVGVPEIKVNGEAVDLSKLQVTSYIFSDGDNTMIPVRVVAEKMGFTVDWNGEDKSVSVHNENWEVKIVINSDSYIGSSIKTDSATDPLSFGSAPKLVDSTTYVPAQMFVLLGYQYTVVGQFVDFNTLGEIGNNGEPIAGGWSDSDSVLITEKETALLDKATEELDGAEYTPVAYLGSQIVAGKNHCILCKITPVVPDPVSTYAIVTLYEDLEGNVEITDVLGSVPAINAAEVPGGWSESSSPAVTEEVKEAFDKAAESAGSFDYSPVAFLGEQVVAGMNYCVLAKAADSDASAKFALVYIYADLSGGAEITEVAEFAGK